MLAIAGCSEDNTHPKVSPVDEPSADAVTILATIDAIPSATGDGEAYAPLWQEGDQIIVGYKGMSYVYETYDAGNGVEFHPVALSLPADARGEVTAYFKAVDGVTFNLKRGTTMGLVGESGCGKTTTGRTILRLYDSKSGGQVLFNGQEVYDLSHKELRALRTKMQIIFQDPFSSLSPRMPVGEIIGEAVREHGIVPPEEYDDYITRVMKACGLPDGSLRPACRCVRSLCPFT